MTKYRFFPRISLHSNKPNKLSTDILTQCNHIFMNFDFKYKSSFPFCLPPNSVRKITLMYCFQYSLLKISLFAPTIKLYLKDSNHTHLPNEYSADNTGKVKALNQEGNSSFLFHTSLGFYNNFTVIPMHTITHSRI